jgi:hypothetical protein
MRRLGSRGAAHGGAGPLTSCGQVVDEVSTATATSRTSGETVLLERPRRAGDATGRLQFVEEPSGVRFEHGATRGKGRV